MKNSYFVYQQGAQISLVWLVCTNFYYYIVWRLIGFFLCVFSPTSDGSGAAIIASEDFVKRHGLENQAVEILAMEMSTDLPSVFDDNSCIKAVCIFMIRFILKYI